MWRFLSLLLATGFLCGSQAGPLVENGESVVLVYNKNNPDSKKVAQHYQSLRGVPASQVFGLDLPDKEVMTRKEYDKSLLSPLYRNLENARLIRFKTEAATVEGNQKLVTRVVQSSVRYIVLCYGVPLKIEADPQMVEPGTDNLIPELKRNEAAVDNELCLLLLKSQKPLLTGPMVNPYYGTTNNLSLSPTNGLFMVARLDGPTHEIAMTLVDKALEAEKNGLWGNAYFDLRGLKDGSYKLGDDWIRGASKIAKMKGMETFIDEDETTWNSSFPMSQVGLYMGWYNENVSGPFLNKEVEFLPGAIAYHLHSHNAFSLRTSDKYWAGPLLAKGATFVMGSVTEPYLGATPVVDVFLQRLVLLGFSVGEAAYSCQQALSWQTTVVGDPLYRPFAVPPPERHAQLEKLKSSYIEWSHLEVVNLSIFKKYPRKEMIGYLVEVLKTLRSAVLYEKLGNLLDEENQAEEALRSWKEALASNPSRMQAIRIYLRIGSELKSAGKEAEARTIYKKLLEAFPDYAGRDQVEKLMSAAVQ